MPLMSWWPWPCWIYPLTHHGEKAPQMLLYFGAYWLYIYIPSLHVVLCNGLYTIINIQMPDGWTLYPRIFSRVWWIAWMSLFNQHQACTTRSNSVFFFLFFIAFVLICRMISFQNSLLGMMRYTQIYLSIRFTSCWYALNDSHPSTVAVPRLNGLSSS